MLLGIGRVDALLRLLVPAVTFDPWSFVGTALISERAAALRPRRSVRRLLRTLESVCRLWSAVASLWDVSGVRPVHVPAGHGGIRQGQVRFGHAPWACAPMRVKGSSASTARLPGLAAAGRRRIAGHPQKLRTLYRGHVASGRVGVRPRHVPLGHVEKGGVSARAAAPTVRARLSLR